MIFEFATAARIVFGSGAAESIGQEAAALGRRAFVLTGARPQRALPLLRRLENQHVMHWEFQVAREPTTDLVVKAAREAGRSACDLVIGIGGGSVLDAAKAVAALLANGGDLLQYLEVVGEGRPRLLEDSGYRPRLAVMSDRVFRLMGVNGKAVLPMVLGLGCDTMATLTTRILPTRKERVLATPIATPAGAHRGRSPCTKEDRGGMRPDTCG